jgi:hypothetical protein
MAAVPAPTLITNSMDRSHDPIALVNAPTLYFTVFLGGHSGNSVRLDKALQIQNHDNRHC